MATCNPIYEKPIIFVIMVHAEYKAIIKLGGKTCPNLQKLGTIGLLIAYRV